MRNRLPLLVALAAWTVVSLLFFVAQPAMRGGLRACLPVLPLDCGIGGVDDWFLWHWPVVLFALAGYLVIALIAIAQWRLGSRPRVDE